MQKCERCNINDARVRLNSVTNGRREQHFYCRQCAEELLGQMNADTSGSDFGGMFNSFFSNGGMLNAAGGAPTGTGRQGGTTTAQREPNKHSKTPTLDQFGHDLTEDARDGKLDPASGRDREIRRVLTVLGRRQKNNPVLIGEPGVGKTAIVEGIARRVAEGKVPQTLRDARIVAVNIGGMVAGAMFRGQFEERVKNIIEEVRANPEVILFIDELHTVVGAGNAEGAVGAADLLKPALARGELRVIGATTLDEYRKHIEKDAAL
ncbi:MAG TPA: AAA family ATPase, partial [Ktedonobacterales bacterium]|nr:AAA family ATPase [Ktedonobacterales bacterium]